MDRLQALRIFAAVAEAQSFAAGARTVGISAPTATRGVNHLESLLGAQLLTRTTRRVRLTDLGRAYLDEVRDILGQLQAADDAVAGAAGTPAGELRITCPQEFGRIHVAPVLTAYLERFPGMRIEVLMVDRVVNLIEEGFDIALRIGHLPSSNLAALRVGQVRQVVCGSPAYLEAFGVPVVPADLATHRIVATAANPLREWRFGPDAERIVRIHPRLSVSSVAASIEIARSGWGLCRALSYQVEADLAKGSLQRVLKDHEPDPLPVHLVHAEGRRAAAKLRSFLDFAAGALRRSAVLRE